MESSSKDLTIATLYPLPKLRVFDSELQKWEEKFPFENQFPIIDKNTYLGIEVETENVQKYDSSPPYWTMIEDGSLRNQGREFITPPIRAWRIEQALDTLFNRSLNANIDFSERTSIHVHMNIRTLTVKQLETLILTYIVFEKALFSFAGKERYENIFCVPIIETTIGARLQGLIQHREFDISWEKYTALNLVPITSKGTIEFRHLAGTKDIKRIITWINLILCLKKFALKNSPDYIWDRIKTLNTTSEYKMFADEVFEDMVQAIWNKDFNKDVGTCVTYVKQTCIVNKFQNELYLKEIEGSKPEASENYYEDPFDPSDIPPTRGIRYQPGILNSAAFLGTQESPWGNYIPTTTPEVPAAPTISNLTRNLISRTV